MAWLMRWRPVTVGPEKAIAPDERLSWPQTAALGLQHVIAMFGATVLAPLLMGFDPNVAVLMSGVGTLLFFFLTGGRVPSYLGSSFAFIGVVIAATGSAGSGPNPNLPLALGGIVACGVLYTAIGLLVSATGSGWVERLMPPVVTGAVVAVIGLNLAAVPIKNMAPTPFDGWMQAATFLSVALVAVHARGMLQRLLILAGLVQASLIYALLTNGFGLGTPIDLSKVAAAPWFGLPSFHAPVFDGWMQAATFLSVALGAVHARGMLQRLLILAGLGQASPIYAPLTHGFGLGTPIELSKVAAAPWFGLPSFHAPVFDGAAMLMIAPVALILVAENLGHLKAVGAVMGGVSIVVFGLIAIAGARIWVDHQVDFRDPRNLMVAAITLVIGTGDFTLKLGGFPLG